MAACAGLPYGLTEASRQLQEVARPVVLVCVEKFSDKIGSARTSRMIFGDGAAAMVVAPAAPAAPGAPGDVEVVQTYAGGPHSERTELIRAASYLNAETVESRYEPPESLGKPGRRSGYGRGRGLRHRRRVGAVAKGGSR